MTEARPDKPFIYLERHNRYSDATMRSILGSIRTIAMVGASPNWRRPSFYAMKYMRHKGYRVIPVNPTCAGDEIQGETVYSSLSEVPVAFDMAQIFRRSEEAWAMTEEALALKEEKKLKVLWMQLTVRDDAAAERAEAGGLEVVMDRCPKIEYARLAGELGWSGINTRLITAKTLRSPRS